MITMSVEDCRAMRPANLLKAAALGAVVAVAVSTTAAAQQGNAYGLGRPAAVANLPAGPFRTALEALPGRARGRALAILQGGEFTDGDLPYLRVDWRGGVFFEEPEWAAGEGGEVPPPAEITQADAFTLHSKPGAPRTIYIDFDGHVVTETIWNSNTGIDPYLMKPYDTNDSPSTWSSGELDVVADVWRRMAEDFAPYDVDVTTQQPAEFDGDVGHILVTYQADENGNTIYGCGGCGGVAYFGGFGNGFLSPGLVFMGGSGSAHNIAEAASHELGHNLYLAHDGFNSTGYYSGHGSAPVDWAPIMGVGYYRNVTQWSKGEYSGANNSEDDLQKIQSYLPYRTDDHEDVDLPMATPLMVTGSVNVVALGRVSDPTAADMANKGIIEGRNDTDLFSLDVGLGLIDLTITPGYFEEFTSVGRLGMNLDLEVRLLDDAGNVLQTSNPDLDTDLGTDAQITYPVDVAGRYYLEISGVGRGDPLGDGYTDYASIGQYYISGTVPEDVTATEPPVVPNDLAATLVDDVNIELSWFDPELNPEANEAGYRVLRSENGGDYALRASLPRDSEFYSDNNLANGTYEYMLELYNGIGTVQTTATSAISVTAPVVAVATSEISMTGSVQSGSYLDTQASAGSEQIREQHQGGKPSRRVSELDHRWTIPGVVPAATVKLYLRASAPLNDDDDDFIFTYTIGSGSPQPIDTLENGTGEQDWTVTLPNDTSGTVVVRVVDNDQTPGNGGTDTVTVYEMHVTSAGSLGNLPPEVVITDPINGITVLFDTELMFAATATDEDGNLADSLSWSMDGSTPLNAATASFYATLAEGTHVVTAQVADSAGQVGSDSVTVQVLPPDTTPPAITVLGDNPATVVKDGVYTDAGATATDNIDGDVTGAIIADGMPFDTSTVGDVHIVTYTVSDAAGNIATATRTVNVVEAGSVLTVSGTYEISRGALPGGVSVTITGTGFAAGATVTFQNGSGPTPSANVTAATATTLTATISGKSGPRKSRVWDVVVTNPGGASAVCPGCLKIIP